jgi:glutaredoxin 3
MIEIYGKPNCPFCDKAKALCEIRSYKFSYKSMGTDYTREDLLEMFPGARTVPQIKVNGTSIGGYDQLMKYVEETGYTGYGETL